MNRSGYWKTLIWKQDNACDFNKAMHQHISEQNR